MDELLRKENHRFYGPETVFISQSERSTRIYTRENNDLIKAIEILIKKNIAIDKYITSFIHYKNFQEIGDVVLEDGLFKWNTKIPSYTSNDIRIVEQDASYDKADIEYFKTIFGQATHNHNEAQAQAQALNQVFRQSLKNFLPDAITLVIMIIANRIEIMCNSMIDELNHTFRSNKPHIIKGSIIRDCFFIKRDEPVDQTKLHTTAFLKDLNSILSEKRNDINLLIENSSLNQVKRIICGIESQSEDSNSFLNNSSFELSDGTIITKTAAIKIICKLLKTFDESHLANTDYKMQLLDLIRKYMSQFDPISCDDFIKQPDSHVLRQKNWIIFDHRKGRLKGIIISDNSMQFFLQHYYNIQMTIDLEKAVEDANKKNFATSQATRDQCILFANQTIPKIEITIPFPDVICFYELIKKLMDSQHDTGRAIGENKGNVILAQNNSFVFLFVLLNNSLFANLSELGLTSDLKFKMAPINQSAFFASSTTLEVSESLKLLFNENNIIVSNAEITILSSLTTLSSLLEVSVKIKMLHLLSIWKFNYYLFTFILLIRESTKKPPSFEPIMWSFFNTSLAALFKSGYIMTKNTEPDYIMTKWCNTIFTQNAVLPLGEICENFSDNQKATAATLMDSGSQSKRFYYDKNSLPCDSIITTHCSKLIIIDSTRIIPGRYPGIQNIYKIGMENFTANWTENITLAGTTEENDTYNVNGFHTLSGNIEGTDNYSINHKHITGNQGSYDENNKSKIFRTIIGSINEKPTMETVITAIVYFMKKAQRDDNFFKNGLGVLDTVFTADLANFMWMITDKIAMYFYGANVKLNKFGLVCPSNRACVEFTTEKIYIETNCYSDSYIGAGQQILTQQNIPNSWTGGGKFAIGDMVFNPKKLAIISIITSDGTYNNKYPNGDIKENISEKDVIKPEKIKICEMLLQIVANSNMKEKEQIQIFLKDSNMCDIIIFCIMFIIKNLSKCKFVVPSYNLDLVDPPEENVANEKATEDEAIKIIEKIFDNGDCSKYLSTFVSNTKFNWLIVRFVEKIYIDYLNDFFILESVKTLKTILLDEPNFDKFEKSFTEIIDLFELSEFTRDIDTKECLKKIIKLSIKSLVAGKINVYVADNDNNFIAIDEITDLLCKDSYSFKKITNVSKVEAKETEAKETEAKETNSFSPPPPPDNKKNKEANAAEMKRYVEKYFNENPPPHIIPQSFNKTWLSSYELAKMIDQNKMDVINSGRGIRAGGKRKTRRNKPKKTRRNKPKKTRKRFQKRSKKFQKKSRKA